MRARVLLLVVLAVTPVVLLTLYTGREERALAAARERAVGQRLARRLAGEQQRLVEDTGQLLFVLAQVPLVQSGDPRACARLFSEVLAQYPGVANLGLARADGSIAATARPLRASEAPDAELLRSAQGGFSAGTLRVAEERRVPVLAVAHPVPGDRAGGRDVFAILELSWLGREASMSGLPDGTTVTVWDQTGRTLVRYPDPDGWLRSASGVASPRLRSRPGAARLR